MIKITCYCKTKTYPESKRKELIAFYREGVANSEGSERERYVNIVFGLLDGLDEICDIN